MLISGSIDDSTVKAVYQKIIEQQANGPIYITINSQGGDEHCARAIAGMIRTVQNAGSQVTTFGFGDIQSAAVLIFAAGDFRLLSRFASVMVHESSAEVDGNASTIKSYAKQMETDEKFWCDILQELTGTDSKTWMKLHNEETYLTPEEALKLNLATELI